LPLQTFLLNISSLLVEEEEEGLGAAVGLAVEAVVLVVCALAPHKLLLAHTQHLWVAGEMLELQEAA
jgi:hypothetical protein